MFPRLRGVPQVDLWLRDACGLPVSLFKDCDWSRGNTDGNPLFAAALPNRFVAVVPASQARELAGAVQTEVRQWLQKKGQEVLERLLKAAGEDESDKSLYGYRQIREQLEGFPEVRALIREARLELGLDDDAEGYQRLREAFDEAPAKIGRASCRERV